GINGIVLRCVGILLIFGGLIGPGFLSYWEMLLYYGNVWNDSRFVGDYLVLTFWAFALPVINGIILFGLFRWGNRKESLRGLIRHNKTILAWATSIFVLWIGSYCLSLMLSPNADTSYSYYRYSTLLAPFPLGGMFAVNALIVWLAIGLILDGLKREQGGRFWSGVLFFLFWAVVRYVDLFSGVGGMLGAAAIFMFCGLFMLGVVYVWTMRRRNHRATETVTECQEAVANVPLLPPRIKTIQDKILLLWQSERNILTAIVLVAALQFTLLGAMIVNELKPHLGGTTIRVTTIPVDPRDLFRGDYVVLRYEFSNVKSLPGYYGFGKTASEQTVFVTMQQKGDLWKPVHVSRTRPKEGVALRGVLKPYSSEIVYGIESYFVQEGTGKAIEDAMRRNRESVVVELTVAPNGKTSIQKVHVR
ncbi:MAG: GDYXXLXY domain-containing protein, partial [Planctomycetaceae bacterium]|nr:GDYXXLXY domain-containing protein [Planctomycetaceae bacterium]